VINIGEAKFGVEIVVTNFQKSS